MKGRTRQCAAMLTAVATMSATTPAMAGIPVFDAMNFASNLVQSVQLKKIQKTLNSQQAGTINYYTKNIDDHSMKIEDYSSHIENHTRTINESTTNIEHNITLNTVIDADFTWIINKGSDDEIIPIPRAVAPLIAKIRGDGDSEAYAGRFHEAADYYAKRDDDPAGEGGGFEGSRARKAANDAWVQLLDAEQTRLEEEGEGLQKLANDSNGVEGHARQLQFANALAVSQVNQLIKMRSMILASDSARAAEAQASSDREARAIATARHLRDGLDRAMVASRAPGPAL